MMINQLEIVQDMIQLAMLERIGEDQTTLEQIQDAKVYALDTETEHWKNRNGYFKVALEGISASVNGVNAIYSTDPSLWGRFSPRKGQKVVFHNAKFDYRILNENGVHISPDQIEDTMIAAFLVNENMHQFGLKALVQKLLRVEDVKFYEDVSKQGEIVDPEVFAEYARNDARYTIRLWELLKPELMAQGLMRVYETEKRIIPVVIEMERVGMKIDVGKISALRNTVVEAMEEEQKKIYDLAGREFNINSTQQLSDLLYNELGLKVTQYTAKGVPSVGADALADLEHAHPIIPLIKNYRGYGKLDSAFLKTLPDFLDENNRIHPRFNQIGPVTGRFSAAEPNVQQIPKRSELGQKIREAFIAEPGYSLVVADYATMEMRVLASYLITAADDNSLADAINSGVDLHTYTAQKMTELSGSDISRTVAKMINFGIAYGITPFGLAGRLRAQGVEISEAEADNYIKIYMKSYPGVPKLFRRVARQCNDYGYVRNLYKRRRRVWAFSARELRQAVNFLIQGSSADIVKDSMHGIDKELRIHAPDSRMIAQIHDELIIEAPDEQAIRVKEIMEEIMTQTNVKLLVPMAVEAKIGKSWAETK
jgi:DNA polymerase-1